jgi:hypothetical protein
VAAYRADIEIGVVGVRALEQLRSDINKTAQAVDSLNDVVGARGGLVQNIENYVNNLNRAAASLERVGAGTQAETKAIQEYVKALGEANAARARQNSLVAQEIANQRRVNPSIAPFGQQGPALPPAVVRGREIQQAWNTFFIQADELGRELQTNAKAKTLNIRNSWNTFFTEAADLGQEVQVAAKAKTLNIRNSWNTFFTEAAQLGQELQAAATAKAMNIKNSWNTFFTEAQNLATDLLIQAQEAAAAIRSREGAASAGARQRLSEEATRRERIQNAGFGMQGPKAPPTGLERPGVLDAILGGGFPMLFGGGPGAIVGGAAGGLIGGKMGGMAGMALSIGLSAVGQKLDQIFGAAIQKTAELGSALSKLDVQALRESTINVTAELDNQVRLLVEAGKYDQARAVIAKEIANQTGSLGSGIQDSTRATKQLSAAWNAVSGTVNTLLAVFTVELQTALAGVLQLVNLVLKGINVVVSGARELGKIFNTYLPILNPVGAFLQQLAKVLPQNTEEQQKLVAAAQAAIDAGVVDLQTRKQRLAIDKQIIQGTTEEARISQIEAERKKAYLQSETDLEKELKQINTDSVNLTAQQLKLKRDIAIANSELQKQEADLAAKRAKQQALLDVYISYMQSLKDLEASRSQLENTQSNLQKTRLQNELQRLQVQKDFNLYLNQEVNSVNAIQAQKLKIAALERDNVIRNQDSAIKQAQLDFAILDARFKAGQLSVEEYQNRYKIYQNTVAQAKIEKDIANEVYKQATYIIEIERKQAVVAEYAAEYARNTEKATRALEEQTSTLSNRASLTAAISQAVQTINNIEIEGLTRELERTSSTGQRAKILERIYELEVQNARVALEATRAQVKAELARTQAAYRAVQLKYEELRAVVEIAKAEGVVNRAHYEALEAQGSALRIAKDNLTTAGQIAQWQLKAADAVFKAAVDAAQLKKEMGGVAAAAGQFAGNMERAAGAMGGMTGAPFAAMGGAGAIQDPGLKAQAEKIWKDAERFAATKGIASIQADILQRARDAIARIAFRDYVLQQKAAGAPAISTETPAAPLTKTPSTAPIPLTAPLATGLSRQPGGGPGTAIIDSFPSTINLQTGPVIQQNNGEKYVSLKDLEQILQDFAATIFENSRTSGGRRYQGVS